MGEPTQSIREDRAFYNAAGDPHLFPTDVFIGRLSELRVLKETIDTTPSRLITLVGPAGVGKTRLALEVVRAADERYAGGAVVVRLAAIDRVDGIIPEIARALGMVDRAEKLDGLVREALAAGPTVLVLDCVEHLVPNANELIAGLLRDCVSLRIVLTSRRPTGIPGEWQLEVQPLTVAVDGASETALRSDAVQLFIDRARKARSWFVLQDGDAETIAELCARYDGLPLAIELLASWVTVLSPKELLHWEPERLEFRTPVADPRHQSLLDAIASSYGLLKPDEQMLLCRLSVFTGGFSRDLVEAMARGRATGAGYPFADGYDAPWPFDQQGVDNPVLQPQDPAVALAVASLAGDPVRLLATLIDHRLVYQAGDIDGVPRFEMLEAIREFGRYQLHRTGRYEAIRHAHAAAMTGFCEASGEGFWHLNYRAWGRERIDADLQNIRSAIAWASNQGDTGLELAARMAGPLWNYWQTRGLVTEGRQLLDRVLFAPGSKEWIRGKELPGLAFLCWIQGDDQRCQDVVDAGLEATAAIGGASSRGMLFLVMALVEFRKGFTNAATMLKYTEEAERLFRMGNDGNGLGACYLIYGQVRRLLGDIDHALELFGFAQETHEASGYEWGIAAGRYFAAEATRDLAEHDPARIPDTITLLHDALARFWAMGDFWGTGGAMSGFACILAMQQEDIKAATYFGAARTLMDRVGGSLLPSELMTHHETEAAVRDRMHDAVWQQAIALGQNAPDLIVEQALTEFASKSTHSSAPAPLPHLTRTQLSMVQDLAKGYDMPRIAQRRGRSLSSTYELADRVVQRLGLSDRAEIVPYAVKNGLTGTFPPHSDSIPRK